MKASSRRRRDNALWLSAAFRGSFLHVRPYAGRHAQGGCESTSVNTYVLRDGLGRGGRSQGIGGRSCAEHFLRTSAAVALAVAALAGATPRPADGSRKPNVVLYDVNASLESARDAVRAAGGEALRENLRVGVATATSSNRHFVTDVAAAQAGRTWTSASGEDAVQSFHVGPASCGAYGTTLGLAETLQRFGSARLADLTAAPARAAREGVEVVPMQASCSSCGTRFLMLTPECGRHLRVRRDSSSCEGDTIRLPRARRPARPPWRGGSRLPLQRRRGRPP